MNRDQMAREISSRTDLTPREAAAAVDAVILTIEQALARGDAVTFAGFGKFHVALRSARAGRNPSTGERIQIASSRVPRFTPGSALKSVVRAAALPGDPDEDYEAEAEASLSGEEDESY